MMRYGGSRPDPDVTWGTVLLEALALLFVFGAIAYAVPILFAAVPQ